MTFGKLFWRVFLIIVLIIIGWSVLGYVFRMMGWLIYAGIAALIVTAILFLLNKKKGRRRR